MNLQCNTVLVLNQPHHQLIPIIQQERQTVLFSSNLLSIMFMTSLHEVIIPSLLLSQILNGHALILLGRLHALLGIMWKPSIIGRDLTMVNGEGDVDAVGWLVEVVAGLDYFSGKDRGEGEEG